MLTWLLTATLALTVPTPVPQGSSDPGAKPLAAGERALAEGKLDEAVHHLLEAWAYRGPGPELASLLVEAGKGDRDAALLWAHAYAGVAADARGKVKLPAEFKEVLGKDKRIAALAAARAGAVSELLKLAESRAKKARKEPSELLVAQWLRRVALDLAEDAPALVASADADALDPRLPAPRDAHIGLIASLEAEIGRAQAGGRYGDAIELARALRGLARQAGFKDLQGDPPDGMDAVERRAVAALEKARNELGRTDAARPWTVEELEALLADSRPEEPRALGEAFTREHASMGRPAVAISPTGKYRIETDCGFETLLGVAKSIEHHHARLVDFYGTDPFEGRPGLVRVVPEAHGLESEGAPFFWAGGFQAGDTTTVRFSIGTIEGLGHGLTHELTHRFDGALFPGQSSWLTEGKAVWTGAAYGGYVDPRFEPRHAIFGTIEKTWREGYGGEKKLRELIEGTIEDYRDNYWAGYALYVYLTTATTDGLELYAGPFEAYLRDGFRGNRNPLAYFERHFVDGEGGRPATLKEFAERFRTWAGGFYWDDRQPWTNDYTQAVPDTQQGGMVFDAPTWTWSRARAEPTFGQDQAREAARLLARAGRDGDAADAFVWGLSQDGRTPAVERELARLYDGLGREDAAWALRAGLGFPLPGSLDPCPLKLSRTRAYLGALDEAARGYAAEGAPRAAAALACDHDRLAAHLGAPSIAGELDADAQAASAAAWKRHGFDSPPAPLARPDRTDEDGWVEDGLTSYEERRVPNLWYPAADGTLHVGRERPREGTGTMDRRAHQRHAFVRSNRWLHPGRYVVSTQVQLTTSYVDAAIVLGYTRRDRNVRVSLNAGNFLYAIGKEEDGEEIESIRWGVNGLFDRDPALPGARPGGGVDFGRSVTSVQVDLVVDGSALTVWIDGEARGTYHTVLGTPIEGYVGFATSMGAIKVRRPTVRRLDRALFAERAGDAWYQPLLNHAFRRDATDAEPSQGRLFLRMAQPDDEEEGYLFEPDRWIDKAVRAATTLDVLCEKQDVRQTFALAISERLAGAPAERLRAELADLLRAEPEIVLYPEIAPPAEDDPDAREKEKDLDTSWLILIDPSGVIRAREPFFGFETSFSDDLKRWLTALRENGFPARDLPPLPTRGGGEEPPPEEEGR